MKNEKLIIGDWQVDASSKRILGPAGEIELEPRVMDLLILLAGEAGRVFSKEEIGAALWGDVHVNDDALTRTVFKLRRALGDDARRARYVETVSKRGYRLIAPVSDAGSPAPGPVKRRRWLLPAVAAGLAAGLIVLVIWLRTVPPPVVSAGTPQSERLARADGFYAQYTRADNEAALLLYEAILEDDPSNASAMAGIAGTLTQRQLRYAGTGTGDARSSLTQALESGWLDTPEAQAAIDRALDLARAASEADPSHPRAWRALGLAQSARGDFDGAVRSYERALVIDPDDWRTMINLSELSRLMGTPDRSLPYLETAWAAMDRGYAEDPVSIRPWQAEVGLDVARGKAAEGEAAEAELWYRRVLARDPLNGAATVGLSALLRQAGDEARADRLCEDLARAGGGKCADFGD